MAVQISGNDITVPRDGSFTRNVTIGGTLTYEDVTNIDSVGLVTARTGIEIGARPGVAASISVDGNMIVSGITTIGGVINASSDIKVGSGVTVGKDGDIFATGVTTTSSLKVTGTAGIEISGDGADLTMPSAGTIFTGNGGNASDPIIRNVSDQNTGVFFPAADTLAVTTGGTERIRIQSDGNIGVNVSNPAKLMHVSGSYAAPTGGFGSSVYSVISNSGSANNSCGLSINAGNNGVSFIQLGDYDDANIGTIEYQHSDNTMIFDVNASEKARINSSGHLGLGSGSNTNKPLHIFRSSDDAEIRLQTNSGTERNSYITLRQSNGDLDFYTVTSSNMKFHTNNTERLKIDSNGYLVKASGLTAAFNVKGGNMTRNDANGYICQFSNDTSSGTFDSGNNFNTSTYKFVAPVSGYYYFFTNIRLDSFNTGYIRTAILSTSYHAGTTYYTIPSTGHVITYADNGSIQTVQTSTVMYLGVNQEAWVYQDPSSDTSYTVYLSESSFGGYFIG